jgi:hypothetical protein
MKPERRQGLSIPARKGTRPTTIRGPLHIQCDGSEDTKYFRRLISEVLAWPHIESTPPFVSSPDPISIHLKQAQGANSSLTTGKEFAYEYAKDNCRYPEFAEFGFE